MEAYKEPTWKGRRVLLEQANFYFGEDKSNTFSQAATKDQLDLMDYQEACKDRSLLDKTVSQMIESFVQKQDMSRKLQVRRKFKVSEKRLWHLEVRTLARSKDWPELEKLTSSKKDPPIGFEPFVEACVEQKSYVNAVQYIKRLPDAHHRMEWLCAIGYWREAVEVAAAEKDAHALQVIRHQCRAPQVVQQIDRMLQHMQV